MDSPKIRFIVRLKEDISEQNVRIEEFLYKFAQIAGVYTKEIAGISIRSGCTIIEGYINRAAIERLHDYHEYLKKNQADTDELKELQAIIKQFNVEALIDDPASNERSEFKAPYKKKKVYILVHGWGGDEKKTFGDLPKYLAEELNIEIGVYKYPSGWLKNSPSITFIARNLDNWIRNNFSDCEVGILGHSLGGLVTRYLSVIQRHRRSVLSIKHITLAASPTNGTHLASLASKIPTFKSHQIEELRPNSGFLVDLNERWILWCKEHTPEICVLTTMYALNDDVVNYTSAIGADIEAIPIYDENHRSIVKPKSKDSEVVVTIVRTAREAGLCEKPKCN